jgi:uncharacterized protein
MIVPRNIGSIIIETIQSFPSVTITGPRQSGKTTLVKNLFPDAAYFSLENPDIRQLATDDPRGFLSSDNQIVILDEIQNTPDLLSYLQEVLDTTGKKFVLTGSNQFQLLNSVNQSLAGRTATFTLLPFSLDELQKIKTENDTDNLIYMGFYPAIYDQKRNPTITYRSYYDTYIERDVRKIINIKDISNFQKFIRICAGRIGQILNANSLSNEIGVSSHTIKSWISALEASYIIFLLPPFYKNINKRLVKSPKLYFYDVGLASYLLGLENKNQIGRDPLYGPLFENLCVVEVLKKRINQGLSPNIFFYRDSNMNEIDIVQKSANDYVLIEIKSSSTFHPNFLKSIEYFEKNVDHSVSEKICLYQGPSLPPVFHCKISNVYEFFLPK